MDEVLRDLQTAVSFAVQAIIMHVYDCCSQDDEAQVDQVNKLGKKELKELLKTMKRQRIDYERKHAMESPREDSEMDTEMQSELQRQSSRPVWEEVANL
jgi:hypothetical protein